MLLCSRQGAERLRGPQRGDGDRIQRLHSTRPLNLTYCAGHCGSSSRYSAAANKMMHNCECCQETRTSQKEAELACADGSKVKHLYTVVEALPIAPLQSACCKPPRRRSAAGGVEPYS
uniref:CTCK domain-containing protein n=1 Tax=Takifugu rubripes TaxID=31033 RepID=A0A674NT24_TAKRU